MSKLSKFRNSPRRFFVESRHRALRGVGEAAIWRNETVLELLENPVDVLSGVDGPLGAVFRWHGRRAEAQRHSALERERPFVSVVMAALNADDVIEGAIRSILEQTYPRLELLIVDDGSTDDTAAIIRALAAEDDRVRTFAHPTARGAAAARNRGLAESQGSHITFQDADDVSHPERLERQLGALIHHDAYLCLVNACRETTDGERIVVNGRRFSKNFVSMMFRRDPVLTRIGFLRELRTGEDAEYYQRARTVFGPRREVHLFQTLYRARFAPDSLLFSHGTTEIGADGSVRYEAAPEVAEALEAALARLPAIARGDESPYVPYP